MRFKITSGEKFSSQINPFCTIVDALKDIEVKINDDLLSVMLLCSLPDDMEHFVVAIECRHTLPKYDALIGKILEEEMRQGAKVEDCGKLNAFGMKERAQKPWKSNSGKI